MCDYCSPEYKERQHQTLELYARLAPEFFADTKRLYGKLVTCLPRYRFIKKHLRSLPKTAGVYVILHRSRGDCYYVGSSKRLFLRVPTHSKFRTVDGVIDPTLVFQRGLLHELYKSIHRWPSKVVFEEWMRSYEERELKSLFECELNKMNFVYIETEPADRFALEAVLVSVWKARINRALKDKVPVVTGVA